MEREDLLLNVSCSKKEQVKSYKLPAQMPDGSKILNENLKKKIAKTHTLQGKVFIPKHKLPVLDEFGLSAPRYPDERGSYSTRDEPQARIVEDKPEHAPKSILKRNFDGKRFEDDDSKGKKAPAAATTTGPGGKHRRKRKKREEEPKIIPAEVRDVAGGLPPSFPKYTLKKFTEGYKPKEEQEPERKRRRFVPGEGPRKRDKNTLLSNFGPDELPELHPYLASNLKQNFSVERFTKVQSLVMPELLDEKTKELIINSGVGSGRTLAYAAPIVNNLAKMEPRINRTSGVYALILLPTRELAAEVNETFMKLCKSFLWVVPGLLTGGERKKSEKARLRKGMNILITTPGRLIDHIEHSRNLGFAKMRYCVIADAHRLFDPERAEVAKKILIALRRSLPKTCSKCLITATCTKKLEKLFNIIISDPKTIDLSGNLITDDSDD